MITGVHALIYTKDPDRARAFSRDVLQLSFIDAGDGWLIFALPPAELGIHPMDEPAHHELFLMCDDIEATVKELKSSGVEFPRSIEKERWGSQTSMRIPVGGELGLYQPKHPTTLLTTKGKRIA